MSSSKRICNTFADAHVAHGVVFALAVTVGGCSADVTRFDFPFFGLTGKGNETASLPTPPESIARNGYDDVPAAPPRGAGLGDTNRGYAPPPYTTGSNDRVASARDYGPPPGPSYAPSAERPAGPPIERTPPGRAQPRPAAGESIQVQQGDTLYGIARRHGVSIAALIEVNGLGHGASIKPGQQLLLPAGAIPASAAPAESRAPTTVAKAAPATTPIARKGWDGRHTMKAGESLYGIARQHGVTLAELQRVNGITEPTRVRVGAVLLVPNRAEPERAPPPAAPRVAAQGATPPPGQARIINAPNEPRGEQRTAALGDRRNDASEPASEPAPAREAAAAKFRWPARGKVIATFGKRTDGTHNDGINIAIPQGTDVHAAESGRVAYAGNELKGYGNLVLIRHDNGWVSAYAHADQILVKRDDAVRRGQVIAKAGRTGTVDQPQLHFELRHGAKPVDPLPHMEK
jgi:murein DD-endopeptidase MepM/ murein hydrolase activator NlpD